MTASSTAHVELMDKIAALVGVRERTCKELRERLIRQGSEPAAVDEALEAAVRVGLVDERRYALAYIRGKSRAGWGRAKIAARLAAAGVPDSVVEECADAFPGPEDELEQALRELSRRPTRSSNPYGALMRRLVGKGYSVELARRAVRLFLDGEGRA